MALVQSKSGGFIASSGSGSGSTTFTTTSVGFDAPTTPGNLLICIVNGNYQSTNGVIVAALGLHFPPTTPGFTWTSVRAPFGWSTGPSLKAGTFGMAYIENAPAMAPTDLTTVSSSTSGNPGGAYDIQLEFTLYEFSGIATSASVEQNKVATGTSSIPNPGIVTTTNDNDLLLVAYAGNRTGGVNVPPGAAYTLGINDVVATLGQAQYRLGGAAGAYPTAFAASVPNWGAMAVAFKAATLVLVPVLVVAPPALSFFATEGGANPSSQPLAISNGDGGTLIWTVTSDMPWLTPLPLSGVDAVTVTASADITGLAAGVYSGHLTFTAAGATNSPTIIPVTLNIEPQPPPPPPPPCPFTLDDADAALAARLYDTSGQFWPPDERFAVIVETLQTWNALTGYWRDDFVFPADPSSQWYDLTAVANTLRPLTITDHDLLLRMEQDLLEPATLAYPLAWTGSAQFAITDLLGAIQRRRDDLLGLSGCAVARSTVPALSGRIVLSDQVAELRRVAFVPDAAFGEPSLVWQDDLWSLDAYAAGWPQQEPGTPDTFRQSTTPPRSFEVDRQPGVPATYELLTINNGPTLSTAAATLLGIPDDWAWVIRWGALADLLSRESNAKDIVRAKYCEARYRQGVALLVAAPALLGLRCNNIPMRVDAVAVADRYRTGWEGEAAGTPELALVASLNLIAVVPQPSDASATFTATVVENAPLPSVPGDCITVTRDLFDVLLGYAQHLASFKMGGAEFLATLPLLDNFMRAAYLQISKLNQQGEYSTSLYNLSQRESDLNPRYTVDVGDEKDA